MKYSLDKFLLFGDSITEFSFDSANNGFGAKLSDTYIRKLDIVNRGFSGYNTNHALYLLPAILNSTSDIKIMTIFLGTNDASIDFQKVPVETVRTNMSKLIQMGKEKDIKIIVIGPGVHDKKMSDIVIPEGFSSNKSCKIYCDAIGEVCVEEKVPFIPLFDIFQKESGYTKDEIFNEDCDFSQFLTDGIHYSSKGYIILFDEIIKVIKKEYPELSPENVTRRMPEWDEINYDDLDTLNDFLDP
ncbi:isoamyl acetate-hydrolyzing esterase [[Candida] jaroonii]|uniref:Isoamyl acetate-hydrolyzing esterase n=1 Tax=[Candida] jaroonii TaxID=467808 RepID=A0ACA9Y7U6_9ASCO|nr:isoamyl acetate-hydrolyzing esterase [[Candida] jaroonii]